LGYNKKKTIYTTQQSVEYATSWQDKLKTQAKKEI
jgi:hypothetical protein